MQERNKIELLSQVLLHDTEPEEGDALERWKVETEDNRKLYELLERVQTSPSVTQYAEEVRDTIFKELNSKIDKSITQLRWLRVSAAAAVAFILLGLTGYLSYDAGYQRQNSQLITLENPLGMKSSVILPDGSKVTLNAGSTLTYPSAFITGERKVSIQGEGFFEVTHDTEHPFIVTANDIQVKVLGTKFNVKAYCDEDNIEVTLSEGRVCTGLAEEAPYIMMEPKQQVRFDKTKRLFSKRIVNLDNYMAWKDGKFYFNSVTFQNIARQLERKFNVHIHIASDDLRNTVFTGDFVRGENLEQILRVMTRDKRIKYNIDGDQISIK